MKIKHKLTVGELVLISVFAALTAVCSQIMIPLFFTPVPLNLATLSVFVAGALLKSVNGGLSQLVYVLLGAIGVPVFAGLTGGFGIIVGPTGGYILGYIVAAFVIGHLKNKFPRSFLWTCLSMAIGLCCCYILGTAWFMAVTKTKLVPSIVMCVLPFLPGDFIKIAIAAFLVKRLENAIRL